MTPKRFEICCSSCLKQAVTVSTVLKVPSWGFLHLHCLSLRRWEEQTPSLQLPQGHMLRPKGSEELAHSPVLARRYMCRTSLLMQEPASRCRLVGVFWCQTQVHCMPNDPHLFKMQETGREQFLLGGMHTGGQRDVHEHIWGNFLMELSET